MQHTSRRPISSDFEGPHRELLLNFRIFPKTRVIRRYSQPTVTIPKEEKPEMQQLTFLRMLVSSSKHDNGRTNPGPIFRSKWRSLSSNLLSHSEKTSLVHYHYEVNSPLPPWLFCYHSSWSAVISDPVKFERKMFTRTEIEKT